MVDRIRLGTRTLPLARCLVGWIGRGLVLAATLSWIDAHLLRAAEPTAASPATDKPGGPPAFPSLQIAPLPNHAAAWLRDGREIAQYHFDPAANRPFVFPLIGPSERMVTRMGHPHDPEGHSHHNGLWISHNDVNGVNFWGDREKNRGRIVHQKILRYDDAGQSSTIESQNHWQAESDGAVVLVERRRQTLELLPKGELLLTIDLEFTPHEKPVTFGKTPFGLMAVRVAKTMGVKDGGGTIRNSEGGLNEKGVFWKQARWVDYSGPVAADVREGVTLLDHPANPNHPAYFHVRDDGWMCASLSHDAPRTLAAGERLVLRYGVYVHAGVPEAESLQTRWKSFSETPPQYAKKP